MTANTDKYKHIFLIEADEKITALNAALLGLEKEPGSKKFADDAMRAAHTLKSSSASQNFMGMSHLLHAMENILENVSSKKSILNLKVIEALFQSVDELSSAVSAIRKGKPEPEMKKALDRLQSGSQAENSLPSSDTSTGSLEPINTVKVDVKTLDTLMNLTEELLVERMKLVQIVRSAKESSSDVLQRKEVENSSEAFDRLISQLQFHVTEARMVPLGQIFERFPRMVRDLAHNQGKEVDFQTIGAEIELDRTIIDRLSEPIIHLLRNAIDHGIDKKGKITLSAKRLPNSVIIKVQNSGNSIDWSKVVEKALTLGIINKTERDLFINSLKNENYQFQSEIEALLYQLSTKDSVTETSGRGVGMGIVKSVIESLGGKVKIESLESGASFALTLPLTLAIIQALLVQVADQTYALPFSQIDRSVRVDRKNIKKAFDQEMAVIEDKDIPMVRLSRLFKIEKKRTGLFLSDDEIKKKDYDFGSELMVITRQEHLESAKELGEAVGLVVDDLLSKQDIVVKPLNGMLRQSKGFAGITLLGDGRPAMILDVGTLLSDTLLKPK
jgi:two-component system, chemotaxis family, sensor kinase CheA